MKLPEKDEYLVGIVSDTHGLVRPEALLALRGTDLIVHAGDIGGAHVLTAFEEVAPVVAVRGNVDQGAWAASLAETEVVDLGGILLYLLHDLSRIDLDPVAAGFHVIVSGHSHQPTLAPREQVLYLNPGSIGPRRFKLPISLALLRVHGHTLYPRFIELDS